MLSGITSSCCTPVLAGILTLTFLSPTFFWAALAGTSYVAGMVAPLVVLALLLEKINWTQITQIRTKTVPFLGNKLLLSDVVAGLIFLFIGVLFIFLAETGQIVMGSPDFMEQTIALWTVRIASFTRALPGAEYFFLIALTLTIIYITKKAWREYLKK